MQVVEKVQELQALIREKFGVEANINISVYNGPSNPGMTRELANYIGQQLAAQSGDKVSRLADTGSDNDEVNFRWVKLETNCNFEFAAFYPES